DAFPVQPMRLNAGFGMAEFFTCRRRRQSGFRLIRDAHEFDARTAFPSQLRAAHNMRLPCSANAEFAEVCDRIVSRPEWSVAVSAATITCGGARARRDDHAIAQSIRLRSDLRRWSRVARSAAQGACGRAL